MKRYLIFAVLFLAVTVVLSQFTTEANNNFADRFTYGEQARQENTTGTYNFDKPHTFIGFRIKHMGLIEVPGYFRDFTGTVNYDAKDVTKSNVTFTAKMTSVDTGVPPRDNHLRSKDFFEVETYPEMTFKSTKVEKKGKGLMITGDFTMKGVTKSISFPARVAGFLSDGKGGVRMGLTADTMINRRDFGVNYEGAKLPNGALSVANEVTITLQIEANKAK